MRLRAWRLAPGPLRSLPFQPICRSATAWHGSMLASTWS